VQNIGGWHIEKYVANRKKWVIMKETDTLIRNRGWRKPQAGRGVF